jgi:FkbH-like protein
MKKGTLDLVLISDSTLTNLSTLLETSLSTPLVQVTDVPFGQHFQVMIEAEHVIWKTQRDVACVLIQPSSISSEYIKAIRCERFDESAVLDEVDEYCLLIERLKDRVNTILVFNWVLPWCDRNRGLLAMKSRVGASQLLFKMNVRLIENLSDVLGSYVLDSMPWIMRGGNAEWNSKPWYLGRILYTPTMLSGARDDIKSALQGIQGDSRKIIFLDLDNTIWGGAVGDLGWENLVLGSPNSAGEAFVDFQRALKSLSRAGILLALVSKNDESVAIEAINHHPCMVLRMDDFTGYRINWDDKAKNISDLLEEIGLGAESAVFIDDNPVERDRIIREFPEILTPSWPESPYKFVNKLNNLGCFNHPYITKEDLDRTAIYQRENLRKHDRTKFQDIDNWLTTLETNVVVEELNHANKMRVAQLFNKTNQMNLSTRRSTESEIIEWSIQSDRKIWTFQVSDKFGDLGLVGILGVKVGDGTVQVTDFVLSCRAMGRKIEETMLYVACEYARVNGLSPVVAVYRKTKRNGPCLDFFEQSGFCRQNSSTFVWDHQKTRARPTQVSITWGALTTDNGRWERVDA